jgi:hypothetical protein
VPAWVPLANAALFVEPVRPVTQMRIRTDFAFNYQFPDKAEYFWARENGKGPKYAGPPLPPGTTPPGSPNLNYTEGFLYFEGAVQRFSMFVELAYLDVEPVLYTGAAGFGDMHVGAKTLLMDCELMQLTSFLQVYLPTGNFMRGLGTGHTAFEPALLTAIKMTQRTYLQGEIAYWFPVGGTPTYQGPIFHTHWSLNHLLWNCGKDIQVIGTAEAGHYSIEGGAYTSPITGLPLSAKDVTNIFNLGPGIRLSICNKFDFGAGSYINVSRDRMAEFLGRLEIRYRF